MNHHLSLMTLDLRRSRKNITFRFAGIFGTRSTLSRTADSENGLSPERTCLLSLIATMVDFSEPSSKIAIIPRHVCLAANPRSSARPVFRGPEHSGAGRAGSRSVYRGRRGDSAEMHDVLEKSLAVP